MSEVIDISDLKERRMDNEPHFNVLALCLRCWHRWIGTVHFRTSLFHLECPRCKQDDSFASFIPDEYSAVRDTGDDSTDG